MHVIAFLSQKGGSGKTTLAVHVAVAAQQAGERVTLIDTDPQGSAQAWARVRKAPAPKSGCMRLVHSCGHRCVFLGSDVLDCCGARRRIVEG